MMRYNEEVMKHFSHPHNMGEIKDADGIGKIGNPVCGDMMHLYIKVKEEKGKKIISDIKVKTFGCVAAIATSSAITDIAKGKTIEEAIKISNKDIINLVKGLPPAKIHCSVLAASALKEAIYDYLTKKGLPVPESLTEAHERIEKVEEKYECMHGRLE